MMNEQEIFEFLNQKAEQYNHVDFIELDPISIPHQFSLKQDIEISGFLRLQSLGETENPSSHLKKKSSILWEILL